MRMPRARSVARALVLGSTAAVLTLGVASAASAADESEDEKEDDGGDLGAPAAAIGGVALGLLGFAASEAGSGPYPEEHH